VLDPSNWRDEAAYAYFDDLDAEGLAWECLRRNVSYQVEFGQSETYRSPHPEVDDACRQRWGLRFRDFIGSDRTRHNGILGTGSRYRRRLAFSCTVRPPDHDGIPHNIAAS
jgi:hypothetical protein